VIHKCAFIKTNELWRFNPLHNHYDRPLTRYGVKIPEVTEKAFPHEFIRSAKHVWLIQL